MTPEQERDRGVNARLLLENDLLQEAMSAIEGEVVKQWEQCPARDKEGKEACWQLLKTAKKFRRLLEGHVQTGRLAEENLRRIEESRLARLGRAIRRAA